MNFIRVLLLVLNIGVMTACQSFKKSNDKVENRMSDSPMLTKPEVKKVWVPPAIEEDGKVYREGYYKWVLEKGTIWSK